ncbi:MAG: 4Fe-4S dicluster domain-containing protein [Clostridia bacterium]|nr:4Fe-4S dicluster domain-containing protein [Clostridia bacterium]
MLFFQKQGIVSIPQELPRDLTVRALPAPQTATLPLRVGGQARFCAPADRQLSLGTRLVAGEDGFGIYSPFDGMLGDLSRIRHPLLGEVPAAAVLVDACVQPPTAQTVALEQKPTEQEIVNAARVCGIIDETDGMRLDEKLLALRKKGVALLVGDACEDQPGCFAALCVLRQYGAQAELGLQLACLATGAQQGFFVRFGDADERFDTLPLQTQVHALGCQYPALPERRVQQESKQPFGSIGVQALAALYRALAFREPQLGLAVSIGGEILDMPRCYFVPFGTALSHAVQACGIHYPSYTCVSGGALRGTKVSDAMPMSIGVTGVYVQENAPEPAAKPCFGCGACANVCPQNLLPIHIMKSRRRGHKMKLKLLHPEDCIGCGACSYVCPSGIDLTRFVRLAAQDAAKEAVR